MKELGLGIHLADWSRTMAEAERIRLVAASGRVGFGRLLLRVRRGGLGAGQWRRDEVLNTRKGLGEATCSRINPWDYVNLLKHHRRMF